MVNQILGNYLDVYIIIYLNNILIYSITLEVHQKYIKEVLIRLLDKHLQYKSEKYEFHRKKVIFLRFLIGRKDIKMNSLKIEKVID